MFSPSTTQQFKADLQRFKHYVCACACVYDFFDCPQNRTPHVKFASNESVNGQQGPTYGASVPEVIHHQHPPRTISSIPSARNGDPCGGRDGLYGTSKACRAEARSLEAFTSAATRMPHNTFLTYKGNDSPCSAAPRHLTGVIRADNSMKGTTTSAQETETKNTTLPEREMWHIL